MSHLVTSDIAIFDLTGHNPNVFYQLAIRHAANKPYIQISDGSPLPFDVTVYRTIPLDYHDLYSVAQAKNTLHEMILAYEQGSIVETPLTSATDVQTLLAGGDPIGDQLTTMSKGVAVLLEEMLGQHAGAIHPDDVSVLQQFIQAYAKAGEVPIDSRTLLESALRSPSRDRCPQKRVPKQD